MTKSNFALVVGFALVLVVAVGGYFYPKNKILAGGISTTGFVNGNVQMLSVSMSPLAIAGTSTSILNNTSQDRAFIDYFAFCENLGTPLTYLTGANLAQYIVNMGTSTVATQIALTNSSALVISTSTPLATYQSSTTSPFPSDVARIWPSGTYEQITFNATSTASCQVGGHYIVL
jgi:hypothetical protein